MEEAVVKEGGDDDGRGGNDECENNHRKPEFLKREIELCKTVTNNGTGNNLSDGGNNGDDQRVNCRGGIIHGFPNRFKHIQREVSGYDSP